MLIMMSTPESVKSVVDCNCIFIFNSNFYSSFSLKYSMIHSVSILSIQVIHIDHCNAFCIETLWHALFIMARHSHLLGKSMSPDSWDLCGIPLRTCPYAMENKKELAISDSVNNPLDWHNQIATLDDCAETCERSAMFALGSISCSFGWVGLLRTLC